MGRMASTSTGAGPSAPARTVRPPTAADLSGAWQAVSARLPATPLLPVSLPVPGPQGAGPQGAGRRPLDGLPALLKLDTFQPTGSFKVRGALAALSGLPEGVRAVTASAGNHGLGMAYAARLTGRALTVVVSRHASASKVAQLRRFPIDLVEHGEDYDAAEAHALALAGAGQGVFVSAYNDPLVIAGQATIGRELDEQLAGPEGADPAGGTEPEPLTVVVPIGGGGLAAGIALWASARGGVRVIGAEAAASPAVSAAIRAGRIVPVPVADTLADGLAGNLEPGSITPGLLVPPALEVATVSEEALAAGIRWLFREHGLVVEGSGAAGVAAVLSGAIAADSLAGRRLVIVLTGRNITAQRYAEVLTSG